MSDSLNESTNVEPEFEGIKFNGVGGEFFKIWIVNLLLSIVTLGIYSPWAKVRTRKYLWGVTRFKGSSFDYHAKPLPILYGRLVALFIFAVYFGGSIIHPIFGAIGFVLFIATVPFFFTKSFKFNVNNTSYRNIRFHFVGKVKEAYKIYFKYLSFPIALNIGLVMLMSLTDAFDKEALAKNPELSKEAGIISLILIATQFFVLIYFLIMSSKILNNILNFVYNNIYYGGTKVSLNSDLLSVSKEITKPYFKTVFVGLFVLVGLLVGGALLMKPLPILGGILMAVTGFSLYAWAFYVGVKLPFLFMTYVWSRVSLGEGKFKTNLQIRPFMSVLIGNTILTGLTLGFYFPWAKVKMLNLKWESRFLQISDVDQITAKAQEGESAIAEEIGDAFDFEFEIGI